MGMHNWRSNFCIISGNTRGIPFPADRLRYFKRYTNKRREKNACGRNRQ